MAVAVGARLDGPDRATVFVPLAAVDDVDQVLPRVAAAVGAILEGSRRPLDVLVEHFEESPTLLVLDNLEQVVDVALELDELLDGGADAPDPRDEPHRAAAAGGARVPGGRAGGAGAR